jgi:hypothetical protein
MTYQKEMSQLYQMHALLLSQVQQDKPGTAQVNALLRIL